MLEGLLKSPGLVARTQLVDVDAYQALYEKAQRPETNLFRQKAIYDYLLACVRCNFLPSPEKRALLKKLKSRSIAAENAVKEIKAQPSTGETSPVAPETVMVYFAGTGNPIGLKDSLFDERIVNTLLGDDVVNPVVIAIPGVGINPENGNIGFSGKRAVRSGVGMGARVNTAYENISTAKLHVDAKVEIMGHSRGAVQALALGKMLSNEGKTSNVFAHDPVLGSHVTQGAMSEEVKPGLTLNNALTSEDKIENILVMTCEDENRAKAFALYEEENAYKAKYLHVASHPGFHNLGVYKGRSSTLNVDVMFSSWIGRMGVWLRSIRSNQDTPFVDQHRDNFKARVYQRTAAVVNAFFKNPKDCEKEVGELEGDRVLKDLSPAVKKNPAYAYFQKPYKRERFYLLPHVGEKAHPEEDKANLLNEYNVLVNRDDKSDEETIREESIFAHLSQPKPLYDFWSRNFAKEVRALNPATCAADLKASRKRADILSDVVIVSVMVAVIALPILLPQTIPYLMMASAAVALFAGLAAVYVVGKACVKAAKTDNSEEPLAFSKRFANALCPKLSFSRRGSSASAENTALVPNGNDSNVDANDNKRFGCFGR